MRNIKYGLNSVGSWLIVSFACCNCLISKGQGKRAEISNLLSPYFSLLPTAPSIHTRPFHQPTIPMPSSHTPKQTGSGRTRAPSSCCLFACLDVLALEARGQGLGQLLGLLNVRDRERVQVLCLWEGGKRRCKNVNVCSIICVQNFRLSAPPFLPLLPRNNPPH